MVFFSSDFVKNDDPIPQLLCAGTMPPHLHPRSRMTSSLFATTVAASFFVVALPHLLPCPVPRTKYADGEVVVDENGRRRRWRRRDVAPESRDGIVQFNQSTDESVESMSRQSKRECPVPKPGGILGEWLGFHKTGDAQIEKPIER